MCRDADCNVLTRIMKPYSLQGCIIFISGGGYNHLDHCNHFCSISTSTSACCQADSTKVSDIPLCRSHHPLTRSQREPR